MNIFTKGVLATGLAASAIFTSVSPANAQDYRYERDNSAAVAIGAGILGLAVGAIAASSDNDRYRDRRYHDRRFYNRGYYANGWDYRRTRGHDRPRRLNRGDRRDWRSGYDRWDNDWRRGDRQRFDSRYYGRRGY